MRRLLVVESRSLPSAAHIYHHVGDAFQSRRPSRQRRTAAVRAFAGMPRRSPCRSCVVVCSARRCTSCVLDLLQDFRSPRRSNTVATVPVYGYGGRAVPSWGPVYRTPIKVCRVRGLVDHAWPADAALVPHARRVSKHGCSSTGVWVRKQSHALLGSSVQDPNRGVPRPRSRRSHLVGSRCSRSTHPAWGVHVGPSSGPAPSSLGGRRRYFV